MVPVERHPSAKCPERDLWRHVPKQLARAANGEDINDVLNSLRLVCSASASSVCRSDGFSSY